MTRAVIAYVNPDDDRVRQVQAILDYIHANDQSIAARCSTPAACAQAISGGMAEVVVAAVDPRNGLREAVASVGGTLALVRERSRNPTLREFLSRAVGKGRTPHDIAHLIGDSTTEVARLIERLGLRRPDDRSK